MKDPLQELQGIVGSQDSYIRELVARNAALAASAEAGEGGGGATAAAALQKRCEALEKQLRAITMSHEAETGELRAQLSSAFAAGALPSSCVPLPQPPRLIRGPLRDDE